MHFNFPPCCVQTQRAGNVAEGRRGSASDVVELLQKCETANVKRNTEVNVVATTTTTATTAEPSNKPTAKCSPPFPLPILFPSWRCTHSLPSTKLFNLLAIYYGSSLWDYRAARRQLQRGRTRRADCRLWAIANKKGGKSTLLWHLILILLPYLSIDSGDCRCGVMCGMGHGADTFCSLTFDVIR